MTSGFLRGMSAVLLACLAVPGSAARAADIHSRYIDGVGGVPLNVVEAGDPERPALIFIHGLGQSHLSWAPQLQSSLADRFHLVAFDLRGHGNSGKPWHAEDYAAPAVWAGDLERVIRATSAGRPVLVAWSYGTWVAIDYLETHAPDSIAGLVLIGALGGLGPMTPANRPEDAAVGRRISEGTKSGYLDDNFAAGEQIGAFFLRRPVDATWLRRTGAANALLPPYARPLVTQRSFDHAGELARVSMPTLVVIGSEDPQLGEPDGRALVARLPDASLSVFAGSGHLPFAEDRDRFNEELEAFASRALSGKAVHVP